jgi:hypothetical protein
LDWSERTPHVGGQLGAAMLATFEMKRWVVRQPDSRELVLTASGSRALSDYFGLNQFERLADVRAGNLTRRAR